MKDKEEVSITKNDIGSLESVIPTSQKLPAVNRTTGLDAGWGFSEEDSSQDSSSGAIVVPWVKTGKFELPDRSVDELVVIPVLFMMERLDFGKKKGEMAQKGTPPRVFLPGRCCRELQSRPGRGCP